MPKNIFILQNTEIGGHLALSVFLTNLLKKYHSTEDMGYSLICGSIEDEGNLGDIRKNIEIYTTDTGLYTIKDNILFSWRTFRILRKSHKNNPIDIIHALYPNSSLLGAILFKVFTSWKTRIIYDVRSPWIEMSFANNHLSKKRDYVKKIMHFSECILIRFVSEFVFITEGTKDYYLEKYKIQKNKPYTIIPSGVEVSDFQITLSESRKSEIFDEMQKKSDEIIIGYVGNLSDIREMDKFIEDNAQIFKNSNHRLVIIGDGDGKDKIERAIIKNSLSEKIILLGKKSRKEVPEYIHCFDYGLCHLPNIFVFQNSFPLKVLEYLSAGKKVLCSDIKAHANLKKIFIDEVFIYSRIIPLLNTYQLTRNKIINKFDWLVLNKNYTDVYKK